MRRSMTHFKDASRLVNKTVIVDSKPTCSSRHTYPLYHSQPMPQSIFMPPKSIPQYHRQTLFSAVNCCCRSRNMSISTSLASTPECGNSAIAAASVHSRKHQPVRSINLFHLSERVSLSDLQRAIQSRQADRAWSLFTNLITHQQQNTKVATARLSHLSIPLQSCLDLYALLNFAKELSYKSTKIRYRRQQQMEQLAQYVLRSYPNCASKEQFLLAMDEIPIMRYKVILKQIRRGNPVAAWTKFIRFHFRNLRRQTVPTADTDINKLPRNACLELMMLVLKMKTVSTEEKRRRLRAIALYGAGTSEFDSRYVSSSNMCRLAYICYGYREHDLQKAYIMIDRYMESLPTKESQSTRADALDELIWRIILSNDLKKATEILHRAQRLNIEVSEMAFVNLMNAFLRQRRVTEALLIFEKLLETKRQPTIRAFNSILNLFAKQGWGRRSEQLFKSMVKLGIEPDTATFTEMIRINARDNNYTACEKYYCEMVEKGVQPNVYTYSALIEASYRSQGIRTVLKWFDIMLSNQVQPNEVIVTNIIKALSGVSYFSGPRHSKDHSRQQQHPDYLHQLLIATFQIAHQASLYGIKVDTVLYTILLQLQARCSGVKGSLEIHQSMLDHLIAPNANTYTTLITICGKERMPEIAQKIFELMRLSNNKQCKPTTITYTALIDVWQRVGNHKKVNELISDFLDRSKSDKSGLLWIDGKLQRRIEQHYSQQIRN